MGDKGRESERISSLITLAETNAPRLSVRDGAGRDKARGGGSETRWEVHRWMAVFARILEFYDKKKISRLYPKPLLYCKKFGTKFYDGY